MMNYCGIHPVNSCQDNRYNRGNVPRVWVEMSGECMLLFLAMLDRQDETGDLESLSNRMVPAHHPDDPYAGETSRKTAPGITGPSSSASTTSSYRSR